jgi:hypothetical protein
MLLGHAHPVSGSTTHSTFSKHPIIRSDSPPVNDPNP